MLGQLHMKAVLMRVLLVLCIIALNKNLAYVAEYEYVFEWVFYDNSVHGWRATHSLTPLQVRDGVMMTTITGEDPYMHSPQISVDAQSVKFIEIRLRSERSGTLTTYWITQGSPSWAEDKTAKCETPIRGDGDFHTYVIDLTDFPSWSSQVLQFRIDFDGLPAGTTVQIEHIKLFRKGPELSITPLSKSSVLVNPNEEFTLGTVLKNTGGVVLTDVHFELEMADSIVVLEGKRSGFIDSLMPGDEIDFKWKLKSATEGIFDFSLKVSATDSEGNPVNRVCTALFMGIVPGRNGTFLEELHEFIGFKELDDETLVIQNRYVALVFPRTPIGYVNYEMYVNCASGWKKAAVSDGFMHILYRLEDGSTRAIAIYPDGYGIRQDGEEIVVVFEGQSVVAESEPVWEARSEFTLGLDASSVRITNEVYCNTDVEVMGVYGPTIYAGEGSFGSTKVDALFSGLEWLIGEERSSSTLDFNPPHHLRLVPDWYKITVPAMAVSDGECMVGLVWDANQKWDGVYDAPAAIFSSPNWFQMQDNHLMGLFLPSTRSNNVKENEYFARNPYYLSADSSLSIEAHLVGKGDVGSLAIIDEWINVFGLPELQELPRTLEEEIELCREGFMTVVWDEKVGGWKHCYEWDAMNIPAFGTLLWVDSILTDDELIKKELRERVEFVIEKTNRDYGRGAFARTDGTHIPGWDLPFYAGGLDAFSLGVMRSEGTSYLATQHRDGEWVFSPGNTSRRVLGTPGETVSGLIATPAEVVLRWGRISGDEKSIAAGLKALDYMEAHGLNVPRGAQSWECPVHSPDILASAKAVKAYIEAYIITRDERYLDAARYWAKTGLPFVYFWGVEDRPVMKGATIPIYGATFFTLSWQGRPVQWNGLVYAYSLMQLARYDDSFPWEHIARLILGSAMWQQEESGERKGTYTDVWELGPNAPIPLYLNPENIMKLTLAVLGADPGVNTEVLSATRRTLLGKEVEYKIHVTSPAETLDASWDDGVLQITLKFYSDETCYTLVANCDSPKTVLKNGKVLDKTNRLDNVSEGWDYLKSDKFLIIKTHFEQGDALRLEIR